MKAPLKCLPFLLVGISLPLLAAADVPATQTADAAIQAIQQAADPSAAVAAYAGGFAVDRNNPKLHEAYVSRMVDLGLPELAYHQAQTLTTLDPNSGLAWGVVAYVDARRLDMTAAISSINLAGSLAPDNKFVVHTAGEILAWYDFKADKSTIPDNAKSGLDKVRSQLSKQPVFTEAYDAAKRAYQSSATAGTTPAPAPQPSSGQAPAGQVAPAAPQAPVAPQVAPAPQAQADQVAPLDYGVSPPPDYYYASYPSYPYYPYAYWGPSYYYYSYWGPGWFAPTPWFWWYPLGWWGGCWFHPFHCATAFCHSHSFHDGHNVHSTFSHAPAAMHTAAHSGSAFAGTAAMPSHSTAQWASAGSQARATSAPMAARTGSAPMAPSSLSSSGARGAGMASVAPAAGSHAPTATMAGAHTWAGAPGHSPMSAAPAASAARTFQSSPGYSYSQRSYANAGSYGANRPAPVARSTWAAPNYSPQSRSYSSAWRGGMAMNSVPRYSAGNVYGGGFHGGAPYSGGYRGGSYGGGFHGGGVSGGGGGFHGGGFSGGGGFHGGGSSGGGFSGGGAHGGGGFGGGGHR